MFHIPTLLNHMPVSSTTNKSLLDPRKHRPNGLIKADCMLLIIFWQTCNMILTIHIHDVDTCLSIFVIRRHNPNGAACSKSIWLKQIAEKRSNPDWSAEHSGFFLLLPENQHRKPKYLSCWSWICTCHGERYHTGVYMYHYIKLKKGHPSNLFHHCYPFLQWYLWRICSWCDMASIPLPTLFTVLAFVSI